MKDIQHVVTIATSLDSFLPRGSLPRYPLGSPQPFPDPYKGSTIDEGKIVGDAAKSRLLKLDGI